MSEERRDEVPQQPTRPLPERVLLTAEEAAELLGIGRTLMYKLITNGEIESIRIGRLRRVPTAAIQDMQADQLTDTGPATPHKRGSPVARRKRPEGTRSPNGASSIYYSEYDKKWHGRVTMGVGDDGKADRRHIKRASEAAVIKEVRRLEREHESGSVRKPGPTWTVKTWLVHWYDQIAAPSVRYKTRTYYRTAIDKYLLPGIGAHRLGRLESEHIERLYGRLRKDGARSSTLLQVHRTLRAALNEAERRDRITKNPIRVVRSPQTEETEIEPLTVDDAQAILAVARERRNGVRQGHRQSRVVVITSFLDRLVRRRGV